MVLGMRVGRREIGVPCAYFNSPKTIVDTGTSNLLLSHQSYFNVMYELKKQVEEHAFQLAFEDQFWLGKKVC